MDRQRAILVVCGLLREARLLEGPGVVAVAGGGRSDLLRDRLDALDPRGVAAVVSFGLAGGLDPGLRVGDVLISSRVTGKRASYSTSPDLTRRWTERLHPMAGLALESPAIAGVDRPALTVRNKADLRTRTGADAVDMESHVAAAYASRHALPFAVLRVVSDGADRTLPPATERAMKPDGTIDVLAVIAGLARAPGQLPALIGTARDANHAFAVLRRVRGLLGPGLGLHL